MPCPPNTLAFRARYVFPVVASPIADGVVTIQDERIIAVGEDASGQTPQDLGNVAILPGLVNAHTHLEFSDLSQPIGQAGMRLPDWINQVVTRRRRLQSETGDWGQYYAEAVARGLDESQAFGTTTLGEIATQPWPFINWDETDSARIDLVVFRELLGLAEGRVPQLLGTAREHLEAAAQSGGRWAAGLSPHAPYTVHTSLLPEVCRLSAESRCPVAMHLAESMEELELLASASGPMVEVLRNLEAWDPTAIPRGIQPLDYLQMLAAAHRILIVHGNYLAQDEIEFLAARRDRMSVVYCPRTHAYFGHGDYPLGALLNAGVNVALGTDSRASAPDLNVLAEMRHAYFQHPAIPATEILRLGTENGARALGLAADTGTLAPGKRADLAVVQLPDADALDPHELVFETELPIVMRVRRGRTSTAA
jgi:aminodeoxyfutalosine deaminase